MNVWPFDDPENVMVLTTSKIVNENYPIMFVIHDEDDGVWQFLDGIEPDLDSAMVVSLKEIVNIDETILELANLPLGWVAWRESPNLSWTRLARVNI